MANRPNSTVNVTGTNGGVGFHSVDGTNVPVGYGGSVPVGKGINANGYAGASVAYGVGAGLLGMAVEYNPVVKSTTLSGSIMGIYGSYTSSPTGWQTDLGIGFIVGAGAHVKGYFASTIEQGAKIRSNWSAKVELE
jgi:hypothetical protein